MKVFYLSAFLFLWMGVQLVWGQAIVPKPLGVTTIPSIIKDTEITRPDGTGTSMNFLNKGVFSHSNEGLLFEWIPSENFNVKIVGRRVVLHFPKTKPSWDGSHTCKGFLIGDMYDDILPVGDVEALTTTGLELPVGNYTFKIIYVAAETIEGQNLWYYMGIGSGVERARSAQVEVLHLSVADGSNRSHMFRESWIPQYQLLPVSLSLPKDKMFGATRYLEGEPIDSIMSKVSHLQFTHAWMGNVSLSKMWRNMQAYNHQGGLAQPDWIINNTPIDRNFVMLSEMAENYGNHENNCPTCYEKAEQVYRGLYERYKRDLGVTSPADTWLISDYFSPLYGGSFYLKFSESSNYHWREGLSSIGKARSRLWDGNWQTSNYFTSGWYEYRNYLTNNYLGNLLQMAGKANIYERIYNLEKSAMAAPDRKRITYITNAQEGLGVDYLASIGVWYRLPFSNGQMLLLDGITHSFSTMYSETFWSLVLGSGVILWESNLRMKNDPTYFRPSEMGGYEPWKTRWVNQAGNSFTYESGKNGAPVRIHSDAHFPEKPLHGDQGAWLAAYDYSKIAHLVKNLYYPDYEYEGRLITAKRGSRGALVNTDGIQNEGQDNIVESSINKLPIVIKGDGVLIYQNPNVGLTAIQIVTVEGKSYMFTGNRIHIVEL